MRTITESESTPKADGFWMPGEYEEQERTWILWPHRADVWRNGAKPAQKVFTQIIRTIARFQPVTVGVNEEDWANSWKAYYKPIKIGEKIVICPAWERYTPAEGEIVIRMDPGMAFGTGTHETTRLVIRLLEKYTKAGQLMLDVGTGTGILAICASRLGADFCRAYDIDPTAVRVARENIKDSGLGNITCEVSDLLRQADRSKPYDLICANIVADIIIRMTPDVGKYMKDDAVLLASGIIAERCDDVVACFEQNGFKVVEKLTDNDWCGLAVMKA